MIDNSLAKRYFTYEEYNRFIRDQNRAVACGVRATYEVADKTPRFRIDGRTLPYETIEDGLEGLHIYLLGYYDATHR